MDSFTLFSLLDSGTVRMLILIPLISAKDDIENRNMASIILGYKVVVIDVVSGPIETIPMSQHGQDHVKQTDNLANPKVGWEDDVSEKR